MPGAGGEGDLDGKIAVEFQVRDGAGNQPLAECIGDGAIGEKISDRFARLNGDRSDAVQNVNDGGVARRDDGLLAGGFGDIRPAAAVGRRAQLQRAGGADGGAGGGEGAIVPGFEFCGDDFGGKRGCFWIVGGNLHERLANAIGGNGELHLADVRIDPARAAGLVGVAERVQERGLAAGLLEEFSDAEVRGKALCGDVGAELIDGGVAGGVDLGLAGIFVGVCCGEILGAAEARRIQQRREQPAAEEKIINQPVHS